MSAPTSASRSGADLYLVGNRKDSASAWVERFTSGGLAKEALVLRALGPSAAPGLAHRLETARGVSLEEVALEVPVSGATVRSAGYGRFVRAVCDRHRIGEIHVASLDGHSLEVFRLDVPCTQLYLDHLPFEPIFARALRTSVPCIDDSEFKIRRRKGRERVAGPRDDDRDGLANAWFDAVRGPKVLHVVSSPGALRELLRLDPRFADLAMTVIEPGQIHERRDVFGGADAGRRLRAGVLGPLAPGRGLETVTRDIDRWRCVADIFLVGSGNEGAAFAARRGCQVIPSVERTDLPELLGELRLDLVLLPPSPLFAFSYALSDAWCFGLPPVGFRHADPGFRIRDDHDGFLLGLGEGFLDLLLHLDRSRERLRRVSKRILRRRLPTVADEVCSHERLRSGHIGLIGVGEREGRVTRATRVLP